MFSKHAKQASNYAKALHYYQLAAAKNDPWALNNIGFLYAHGKGVEQSDDLAMEWYQKAASLGHFDAQYNIGARYARGQGVQFDLVTAHFWMSRAKIGATALQTERADKTLELLEREMSAEAQEEAKHRLAVHLNEA